MPRIEGRGLPQPVSVVSIMPSLVEIRIDDELNREAWVSVFIDWAEIWAWADEYEKRQAEFGDSLAALELADDGQHPLPELDNPTQP